MFKVGDKVKFLNDVGGGTITRVLNKNSVYVENEDGFEIPVTIAEIILDQGFQQVEEEEVKIPVTRPKKPEAKPHRTQEVITAKEPEAKPIIIQGNDKPEFYMAFVPENAKQPMEGPVSVYLINDSNFFLLYHYSYFSEGIYETQEAGKLEPNTKLMLGQLAPSELNNLPAFCIQGIYYSESGSSLNVPFRKQITISSVKFYKSGSFRQSQFFDEPSMVFKLNESEMEKALKGLTEKEVKKAIRQKEPARKKQLVVETPEIVEVDLHIDELLDTTAGLSNKDMMEVQLKTFREKMEEVISNQKVKRIVFIHGIGNGVLKRELRRELSSKYRKYSFQDASFQEYGYGATMVIIRKK